MKPTSRLNILFLIFLVGMTSLHGAPIQNCRSSILIEEPCNSNFDLKALTQNEMILVQGSKLNWPFNSAGPFTVVLEAVSIVGFGLYKSIVNSIGRKELKEKKERLQREKEELLREVQALQKKSEK